MEGKENTVESFTEVLCRGFPKSKLTAVYRYCRTSHRRLLSLQAGSRFGVTPCGAAAYYTIGGRLRKHLLTHLFHANYLFG